MTQPPKKRVRRPKGVPSNDEDCYYADIEKDLIYIGGHSYGYPQQIHITKLEFAKKLHKWLGRAIQYLEHKGE